MTSSYRFRVQEGQSAPYRTITADSDAEFYSKLRYFEGESGLTHIQGTIEKTTFEITKIPEPEPALA